MLMPSLDTSIANAGLPTLAHMFAASFQAVQWVVLAYLLAITALIVGVGLFGDIIGRRRLLLAGIVLFTATSLLCGIAPSLWFLIAARAAQGLGAAIMMALTLASVGETVPKEKIGSAMGLLGTMSAIGTTLGPSLGGLLITSLGWRSLFLINVPLGIINFYLAHRFLVLDERKAKKTAARFDKKGTLVLAFTLAAYALSMTIGKGQFGALNLVLLFFVAFGIALFIQVEAKAKSPLIRLSMFRIPNLSAGLAMSTLVSAVMMSTLVVGPFYLFYALGLKAGIVGFSLSVGPFASALTGLPAGRIVDRFGAHSMTLVGLIGIGFGCLVQSFVPLTLGIFGYLTPIVCITASYALFQAANNTAIMKDISSDQRGVISGLLSLSRNLGLISGAAGLGAVFAFACETPAIESAGPNAIAAGMQITFRVGAVLVAFALAIAIGSRRLANHPLRAGDRS
jgi:EmrB/QacA subfamily drug resistance transporter